MPKKKVKIVTHNKKFPVVKTSRTNMLNLLNNSQGKFITVTHIGKDQKEHTNNGMRYKNQNDPMGYIRIYSIQDKGPRLVNPQTLTQLSFQGNHYVCKK